MSFASRATAGRSVIKAKRRSAAPAPADAGSGNASGNASANTDEPVTAPAWSLSGDANAGFGAASSFDAAAPTTDSTTAEAGSGGGGSGAGLSAAAAFASLARVSSTASAVKHSRATAAPQTALKGLATKDAEEVPALVAVPGEGLMRPFMRADGTVDPKSAALVQRLQRTKKAAPPTASIALPGSSSRAADDPRRYAPVVGRKELARHALLLHAFDGVPALVTLVSTYMDVEPCVAVVDGPYVYVHDLSVLLTDYVPSQPPRAPYRYPTHPGTVQRNGTAADAAPPDDTPEKAYARAMERARDGAPYMRRHMPGDPVHLEPLRSFEAISDGNVLALLTLPDGRLVVGGQENALKFYDAATLVAPASTSVPAMEDFAITTNTSAADAAALHTSASTRLAQQKLPYTGRGAVRRPLSVVLPEQSVYIPGAVSVVPETARTTAYMAAATPLAQLEFHFSSNEKPFEFNPFTTATATPFTGAAATATAAAAAAAPPTAATSASPFGVPLTSTADATTGTSNAGLSTASAADPFGAGWFGSASSFDTPATTASTAAPAITTAAVVASAPAASATPPAAAAVSASTASMFGGAVTAVTSAADTKASEAEAAQRAAALSEANAAHAQATADLLAARARVVSLLQKIRTDAVTKAEAEEARTTAYTTGRRAWYLLHDLSPDSSTGASGPGPAANQLAQPTASLRPTAPPSSLNQPLPRDPQGADAPSSASPVLTAPAQPQPQPPQAASSPVVAPVPSDTKAPVAVTAGAAAAALIVASDRPNSPDRATVTRVTTAGPTAAVAGAPVRAPAATAPTAGATSPAPVAAAPASDAAPVAPAYLPMHPDGSTSIADPLDDDGEPVSQSARSAAAAKAVEAEALAAAVLGLGATKPALAGRPGDALVLGPLLSPLPESPALTASFAGATAAAPVAGAAAVAPAAGGASASGSLSVSAHTNLFAMPAPLGTTSPPIEWSDATERHRNRWALLFDPAVAPVSAAAVADGAPDSPRRDRGIAWAYTSGSATDVWAFAKVSDSATAQAAGRVGAARIRACLSDDQLASPLFQLDPVLSDVIPYEQKAELRDLHLAVARLDRTVYGATQKLRAAAGKSAPAATTPTGLASSALLTSRAAQKHGGEAYVRTPIVMSTFALHPGSALTRNGDGTFRAGGSSADGSQRQAFAPTILGVCDDFDRVMAIHAPPPAAVLGAAAAWVTAPPQVHPAIVTRPVMQGGQWCYADTGLWGVQRTADADQPDRPANGTVLMDDQRVYHSVAAMERGGSQSVISWAHERSMRTYLNVCWPPVRVSDEALAKALEQFGGALSDASGSGFNSLQSRWSCLQEQAHRCLSAFDFNVRHSMVAITFGGSAPTPPAVSIRCWDPHTGSREQLQWSITDFEGTQAVACAGVWLTPDAAAVAQHAAAQRDPHATLQRERRRARRRAEHEVLMYGGEKSVPGRDALAALKQLDELRAAEAAAALAAGQPVPNDDDGEADDDDDLLTSPFDPLLVLTSDGALIPYSYRLCDQASSPEDDPPIPHLLSGLLLSDQGLFLQRYRARENAAFPPPGDWVAEPAPARCMLPLQCVKRTHRNDGAPLYRITSTPVTVNNRRHYLVVISEPGAVYVVLVGSTTRWRKDDTTGQMHVVPRTVELLAVIDALPTSRTPEIAMLRR